jgi:CDP-glucose 4,6-dehydratase
VGIRKGTVEGLGLTQGFWREKRVCVTGHTGFKGSWLCIWLRRLGAAVSGYALPPNDPSLFLAASVSEITSDARGDVTDTQAIASHFRAHKSEIVFHLAAQPLVRRSYESPLETYHTNIYGTASVLEAVRTTPTVRAALIITSDKCYDLRKQRERYREGDALGGDDPYSASKAAAEHVVAAYRASYWEGDEAAPRVASLRAGNVIGGGDWSRDRLLPDLIAAFSSGTPALIRNPSAIRPWQHVLDPLRGYLMLAERLWGDNGRAFAKPWNFGPSPNNEWSVRAVADLAAAHFGAGAAWRVDDRLHPHEAPDLRLDSSLAATELGWQGQIPLRVAVERTIDWRKAFVNGTPARVLCEREIEGLAMGPASA